MEPEDIPPVQGPIYMRPGPYREGLRPAQQMLNSDLLLQRKIEPAMCTVDQRFGPIAAPPVQPENGTVEEADLPSFQEYLQSRETNLIVPDPTPTPPAETAEEEPFWNPTFSGPSMSSEDGGVSVENRRGVREYLASGYTRRNPDGTYERDDDFGGKWDEEVTIAELELFDHEFFDVAVEEGSFGNDDTFFSGEGKVLSADANATSGFELTNEALTGTLEAQASGSLLEGSIETADDGVLVGEAEGSVVSGDATAKAEVIVNAEQATLAGEVGAEVNLIEGSVSGEINITPRRAVNGTIEAWKWMTGDDVGFRLGENWDVGIMVGGEVSGQVGAQIGAEGEIGYEDGRATAEAGAKIGLGVGVGVKARGGIVGADVIGRGIGNAWSGIKNAWNSDWF